MDDHARLLGFHAIGEDVRSASVPMAVFRRQIDWLVRHRFQILTLAQWWRLVSAGERPGPRAVILSFDDGFRSVWRHAAPVLSDYGLSATLFVVTDYVGQTNAYDRGRGAAELPLMDWDELEALKRRGWDLQSHGRRHYRMVNLTRELLEEEAAGSKRLLEQRLGDPVDFFCYPYGAVDAQAVDAVARAGYVGAVTCWEGALPQETRGERFLLPRVMAERVMSPRQFAYCFTPSYRRLTRAWSRLRRGGRAARGRGEEALTIAAVGAEGQP